MYNVFKHIHIPNSIKFALVIITLIIVNVIGHWAFGHTELTAMIFLICLFFVVVKIAIEKKCGI